MFDRLPDLGVRCERDVLGRHHAAGRVGLERDELAQVLGRLGMGAAQQSADETETGPVVAVVETREGMRIAGAMGAQQLGILRGVIHQVEPSVRTRISRR